MSDSDDDVPIARRLAVKPEIKAEAQGVVKDDAAGVRNPLTAKSTRPKVEADGPELGRELVDGKADAKANANANASLGKPQKAKKRESPGSRGIKEQPKKERDTADHKPKDEAGEKSSQKENERKQVKKIYEMPGQTRETPPEEDPLRRFYTTLLEQVPTSEMARRWCAIHGLLDVEAAAAWVEEQARKRGSKSPSKSQTRRPASVAGKSSGKTSSSLETKQKTKTKAKAEVKKRKVESDDDDDDDNDDFKSTKKPSTVKTDKVKKNKKATERNPKSMRDVAFADGGLDGSDSDDDVPLHLRLQRAKAGR